MTVKNVHFGDKVNHKTLLRKLIDDDEVTGVQCVAFYKDGACGVCWSDLENGEQAYGAMLLQSRIMENM